MAGVNWGAFKAPVYLLTLLNLLTKAVSGKSTANPQSAVGSQYDRSWLGPVRLRRRAGALGLWQPPNILALCDLPTNAIPA
jgi:hypothetical protein